MRWKWLAALTLVLTLLFSGCAKNDAVSQDSQESGDNQQEVEEQQDSQSTQVEFTELEPDVDAIGEGTPSYDPVDLEQSDSYQVGDVISLQSSDETLYELTIDEIAFTDARDEYTQDPGNVILVTYTYKNLSDQELLIDEMRFQMMLTDGTTLLDSYYLADVSVPEPTQNGEACTAQIAYSIGEKPESVVLAYHDTVHTEIMPVQVTVNNLQ